MKINVILLECFKEFQQQNYSFVVEKLSPLFEKIPFNRDVHFIYARSLRGVGNLSESERVFLRILTNQPRDEDTLCALGNLKLSQLSYDSAITIFSKLVKLSPSNFNGYYNLGRAYLNAGFYEEAKHNFLMAQSNNKRQVTGPIIGILNALQKMGAINEALEFINKIKPPILNQLSVKLKLADIYKSSGDKDRCLSCYDSIYGELVNDPTYMQAYIHSLVTFGEFIDAQQEIERLFSNKVFSNDIVELYWQTLWQLKGVEAIQEFKTLVVTSNNIDITFNFFSRLIKLENYELVIELSNKLPNESRDDPRYCISIGISLRELGHIEKALETFKTASQIHPNNLKILFEFIVTQLCFKDHALGLQLCKDLLERDSKSLSHWALYATCLKVNGKHDEYRELYDYDKFVKVYNLHHDTGASNLNASLREEIYKLNNKNYEPVEQSVKHGSQTLGQLFDNQSEFIQLFKNSATKAVNDHVKSLFFDSSHIHLKHADSMYDFIGSWSVKLSNHGFHLNHYHNEGWLSAAYYVSVPEAINKKGEGWLTLGQPNLSKWINLEPDLMVKPEPGLLVIFPSYMWHGTRPFSSTQERISIAFDVAPI